MKVARVRQLSKLEGDLRADGYELGPKIISYAGKDTLILTIALKPGDVERIKTYWSCVRVLTRR